MVTKIRLSPEGYRLLKDFRVPRSTEGRAERLLDSEKMEKLINLGILSREENSAPPIDFFSIFQGWKIQRTMLLDRTRTLAFLDAITALVKRGDVVVDIGAGSGILSMFAARAGAGRVFGLEITNIIKSAALIAATNDFSTIEFISGDAATFKANTPVDIIVSEFAGMYLLDEWRHFASFVSVRNNNLRPTGNVIPNSATMYLSMVDDRKLYMERGFGFWQQPVYGLDFSNVLDIELHDPRREIVQVEQNSLVDIARVASFDYKTANISDYFFETEIEFTHSIGGSCHGFIGHFELEVAPGRYLSTAPTSRQTHWHQSYFPIKAINLRRGEKLHVFIRTFLKEETEELCLALRITRREEVTKFEDYVYSLERVN